MKKISGIILCGMAIVFGFMIIIGTAGAYEKDIIYELQVIERCTIGIIILFAGGFFFLKFK